MKFYTILFLALGTATVAYGQENSTVDVDKIINTYIENIGGTAAWSKIKSIKTIGESVVESPMGTMNLPTIIQQKRENKMRLSINIEAIGAEIIMAYDGKIGWQINPMTGFSKAQKMSEAEAKEFGDQDIEDAFINYKTKGHQVKYLGEATIEGTATHKIKLMKKSGIEQIYHFDQEKNMPIMISQISDHPQAKGVEVQTFLSDYQKVGDIVMHHSMTTKIGGQTARTINFKSVEINTEIDDKVFEFPSGE